MSLSTIVCSLVLTLTGNFYQVNIDKDRTIQQVETLERKRLQALVDKDYTLLGNVFSDDLVYTHSNGKVDNRESYIESIKNGSSVYEKIVVEEMTLRKYGKNTILINAVINISGNPAVARLRYSVVYIKNKGKGWQLVNWQSTKLA